MKNTMARSNYMGCVLAGLLGVLLLLAVAVTDSLGLVDTEGNFGRTSAYRRKLAASVDLPYNDSLVLPPPGVNPPQQVHLTQGDYLGKAVIVTWITEQTAAPIVYYGTQNGSYVDSQTGNTTQYTFYNYTSGFIHIVTLSDLEYNTKYYYKLGDVTVREFFFFTPPAPGLNVPYIFGLIGDLGQTYDSATTLAHYLESPGQTLLNVGDLSYADDYPLDYQVRWDTWSRFVERSAAYQPWIWTAGNHELEFLPEVGEITLFKSFTHRFPTPYTASNSTDPVYYSIKRGPAHIIVLSSYSAYGKYDPQQVFLLNELASVNRTLTPWLIVLIHAPWYNSNTYHYLEGETVRVEFEGFLNEYQVDVVFSGHVHAYERTYPVSNILYNITNGLCTPRLNNSAPTYIVIGDGGNIEGIAGVYTEPQPNYSAYREASFGHGLFQIYNHTHAEWTWHRNQDGEAVVADSAILHNKVWYKGG